MSYYITDPFNANEDGSFEVTQEFYNKWEETQKKANILTALVEGLEKTPGYNLLALSPEAKQAFKEAQDILKQDENLETDRDASSAAWTGHNQVGV